MFKTRFLRFLILFFIYSFITINCFSQNDYATINIYRPGKVYGFAVGYDIYINNKNIVRLNVNSHLSYRIYQNKSISIKFVDNMNNNSCSDELDVEIGKNYYYIVYPKGFNIYCGRISQNNKDYKIDKVPDDKKYVYSEKKITKSNYQSIITDWNELKLKEYWKQNGLSNIEGIYESSTFENGQKYRLGLIKIGDEYQLINLLLTENNINWRDGELKAILSQTATPNLYKTKWYMSDKSINYDYFLTFENGLMTLLETNAKTLFIKMYPTSNDEISSSSVKSTGSGFAISTDGLIVTNNHVVKGAKTLKIKGINNDFSKTFNAKVIINDEKNDLAIIKIDDNSFTSINNIPYCIKSATSEVGLDIFVLGYPLTASMGEEIKLTNGIISARSGFQGDITSYQITAPIQPGNSGAPLFDRNGFLIGIVNAKHTDAENAGYAIKTSYLNNLIESLPYSPKLPAQNSLINKPLTEQVKSIKEFVYLIVVN